MNSPPARTKTVKARIKNEATGNSGLLDPGASFTKLILKARLLRDLFSLKSPVLKPIAAPRCQTGEWPWPIISPAFPGACTTLNRFYSALGHETSRGFRTDLCPQRILCSKCGELLYTGLELETPGEIIQRNGGYCPKCGKKLGFDTENLKIIPETPIPGP
jgi:hypothetical protein